MAAASNDTTAAVKPGGGRPSGGGFVQYLREVRAELKKAEWPTREQLIKLTQVVLTLIFLVAVYCGLLDSLLGLVTNRLFGRQ
ncbi:MAG TPA: preprotein translocase subunit SecE [Armatimonadaceae bacterium]|nr:preprotein translocase subunit SecE [Armatimonadaceae bacterium]